MSKILTMRFDEERFDAIEAISKQENMTQTEVIRELFDYGRIDLGVKLYSEKKASLERAAKIAGISISDFLEEMQKRGIESNVSLEDFKESLKNVKKMIHRN